jgi:hypothetical protein
VDKAETIVAVNRLKSWPKEWHKLMLELPAQEAEVVGLLVALLDARPGDGQEGTEG